MNFIEGIEKQRRRGRIGRYCPLPAGVRNPADAALPAPGAGSRRCQESEK